MTVRTDADLSDSTNSDALLKKVTKELIMKYPSYNYENKKTNTVLPASFLFLFF